MEKELPIPKCFDDPADAAARLKEMFVDIGQARDTRLNPPPAQRAVFRKLHGVAHGWLERHADVPQDWRVGIFAHERLTAWMRFSSDTGPTDPDLGSMCGIGIKLFGVPGENALVLHMHELLQYLNRQGATTFVTIAQHGLVGDTRTPVDVTYLADTVILLRYFETRGRLRRAISVVKKRTGAHEDTIREYSIGADGVRIGEALVSFQGMARGVRSLFGDAPELIEERH